MSIEFDRQPESNVIVVRGEMTIYTIGEARQALTGAHGASLDLSQVAEFDGAGLQLLLALRRDAEVRVSGASDVVNDTLRLTGLAGHFDPLDRTGGNP